MEALLQREGQVDSWNDDRLDELSRRMDAGFEAAATKTELAATREEMNRRFDEMGGEMNRRFDEMGGEMNRRFDETGGETNRRFDEMGQQMDLRFGEVGRHFDKIDAQLLHINDRLDRQHNTLLVAAFGVIAALIANGIFG
jgi:DNA anti-recombination protein RmuC